MPQSGFSSPSQNANAALLLPGSRSGSRTFTTAAAFIRDNYPLREQMQCWMKCSKTGTLAAAAFAGVLIWTSTQNKKYASVRFSNCEAVEVVDGKERSWLRVMHREMSAEDRAAANKTRQEEEDELRKALDAADKAHAEAQKRQTTDLDKFSIAHRTRNQRIELRAAKAHCWLLRGAWKILPAARDIRPTNTLFTTGDSLLEEGGEARWWAVTLAAIERAGPTFCKVVTMGGNACGFVSTGAL